MARIRDALLVPFRQQPIASSIPVFLQGTPVFVSTVATAIRTLKFVSPRYLGLAGSVVSIPSTFCFAPPPLLPFSALRGNRDRCMCCSCPLPLISQPITNPRSSPPSQTISLPSQSSGRRAKANKFLPRPDTAYSALLLTSSSRPSFF